MSKFSVFRNKIYDIHSCLIFQPRKVTSAKTNPQTFQGCGDHVVVKEPISPENIPSCATDEDKRLWNYVHGLLYRTTTGSTYLPPSVHGEPMCHPTKYHPSRK